MEQDTNVSMDVEQNDGSELFADYFEEDTNSEAEAEQNENPTTEEAPEQTQDTNASAPVEQTHKLKFLGEEKTVSYEELVNLAQKGMNADHVLEKMANSREYQLLDKLAGRMGMTREQYLNVIEKNAEESEAKQSADALLKKFPELTPEAAAEFGKQAAELERMRNAQKDAAAEKAKREEAEKPMRDFVEYLNKNHPDAEYTKDVMKLPESVLNAMREGKDPTRAMMEYEISEAKRQIQELTDKQAAADKAKAKNEQNKKQSVGSVAGNAGDDVLDAFLSGLTGG